MDTPSPMPLLLMKLDILMERSVPQNRSADVRARKGSPGETANAEASRAIPSALTAARATVHAISSCMHRASEC